MLKERLQLAPKTILMLDDYYLESKCFLSRFYHQPVKFEDNPILCSGQVRREKIPLLFGSVQFDPFVQKYRMWYMSCRTVKTDMNVHDNAFLALAESTDGIHWERVNIEGRGDNCVFGSTRSEIFIEVGSILIDENAPREKRYLMIYCAKNRRNPFDRFYRLAFSEDGIRWKRYRKVPIERPGFVDRHALLQNRVTGEYLLFCRGQRPIARNIDTVDSYERTVCLQKSVDLEHWSQATEVMCVDAKERAKGLNVYSLCPFYREETLMGIYQLHNMCRDVETVTTHLCWSYNNGLRWRRRKEEFIPLGEIGQWDRFNNAVSDVPLIIDDTMYFFYSGRTYRHGGYEPEKGFDSGEYFGGIGFATMKLDRFASLASSFDGGTMITKQFIWPEGAELYLNADCRWGKIDILMKSNNSDSKQSRRKMTISGENNILIPVKLKARRKVPFSLEIKLFNAHLYAMYWK